MRARARMIQFRRAGKSWDEPRGNLISILENLSPRGRVKRRVAARPAVYMCVCIYVYVTMCAREWESAGAICADKSMARGFRVVMNIDASRPNFFFYRDVLSSMRAAAFFARRASCFSAGALGNYVETRGISRSEEFLFSGCSESRVFTKALFFCRA